jgi:hypothetical protein
MVSIKKLYKYKMDKSKSKYLKQQKKKPSGPITYSVAEGINKKFLIAVNDNLYYFKSMNQSTRDAYLAKYNRIMEPLTYLSPIYFASAVAFIHDNKGELNEKTFDNKAVEKYVSILMSEFKSSISASEINLRRKIEFLRYIRMVLLINSNLEEEI